MKNRSRTRVLSLLLTAAMLLTLLPGAAFAAADSGDFNKGQDQIGAISSDTFQELNFNVDGAQKEVETLKQQEMGKQPMAVSTINELMMGGGFSLNVYNLMQRTGDGAGNYRPLENKGYTHTKWSATATAGNASVTPIAVRSVAFDPDGSAKDEYIAQVLCGEWDNFTYFFLRVSNGVTGKQVAITYLGNVLFQVNKFSAGAMLAITAGDYDGDGKEEIAVFSPQSAWGVEGSSYVVPSVVFYEFDSAEGSKGLAPVRNQPLYELVSGYSSSYRLFLTNEIENFPVVSLATMNGGEKGDSLAVAVSVNKDGAKNENYPSYGSTGGSWLSLCTTPLMKENSSITRFGNLSHRWDEYGTSGDYALRYENMRYPGVAVGDINSDGKPEIVVAGYRATGNAGKGSSEGTGWNLDKNRMLITYFAQDDKGNWSRQTPMQWIGLAEGDYKGATSLGLGLQDDTLVMAPAVKIFSERGPQFNNSIFVNGIVLNLPTGLSDTNQDPDVIREENERGMYSGTEKTPDRMNLTAAGIDIAKVFRIDYAAPLRAMDTLSAFNEGTRALGRRTVVEAAVGNFDGNALGREQVAFIYLAGTSTGVTTYRSTLCLLGNTAPKGEKTAAVGNSGSWDKDKYHSNIANVSFSAMNIGTSTVNTVAAPDVDDDSTIIKYDEDRAPEFYFSDPMIVAVLQAAPYFEELKDDMEAEPRTSFSQITGSESGLSVGVTTTSQLGFGIDISVDAGPVVVDMEIAELQILLSATMEMSNSMSTTYASEFTKTFSAGWQDAVILHMTPYVRHYYKVYDPVKGTWSSGEDDWHLDVPGTPQLTSLTVDDYDAVAEKQGWDSLRDAALYGAQAGDPNTYLRKGPVGMIYADALGSQGMGLDLIPGLFNSVGYGGGSTSVEVTKTAGFGTEVEVGAGVSVGAHVKVVAVAIDAQAGMSVTSGFSYTSYAGTAFAGEVPDLPAYAKTDYGFVWNFGTYMANLSHTGNKTLVAPVMGYLVDNVKGLPKAPADLEVDEAGMDSVTLRWSKPGGTTPSSYEVGLWDEALGDYIPLATVDAPENANEDITFTDTNCAPGETYQYAVRSKAIQEGIPQRSAYSERVTAVTWKSGGVAITAHPEDRNVRAGGRAEFSIGFTSGSSADTTQLTWQQRRGTEAWSRVPGDANNPMLILTDVTRDMSGMQYRCAVFMRSGGVSQTLYSKAATLTVGQGDTVTALTLGQEEGKANDYETVEDQQPVTYMQQVTASWDNVRYNVLAQQVLTKAAEYDGEGQVTDPAEYRTDYYLSHPTTGAYFGSGEVTKEKIDALTGKDVDLALAAVPVEIKLTREFSEQADGQGEVVSAAALDGVLSAAEYRLTVPYEVKSNDYQHYKIGGKDDVYAVPLGSETLYFHKNSGDTYKQMVLTVNPQEAQWVFAYADAAACAVSGTVAEQTLPDTPAEIAFASTIIFQNCGYYAGSSEGDEQTQYPAVAIQEIAGETCYFTVTADTTAKTLTGVARVYLKTAYSHGEGPTALPDFDPEALAGVEREVSDTVKVSAKEARAGDEITLTAKVKPDVTEGGGTVDAGAVSFRIVNTQAGYTTTFLANVTGGEAEAKWTAPQPGSYAITAAYQGAAEWRPSQQETPQTYQANAPYSAWLALGGDAELVYGKSTTLEPVYYPEKGGAGETEISVSYAVTCDGVSVEPSTLIKDNVFTPDKAGAYLITAAYNHYNDKNTASITVNKSIVVSKAPIKVVAKEFEVADDTLMNYAGGDGTLKVDGDTLEISLPKPEDYYSLFDLTIQSATGNQQVAQLSAGEYPIQVAVAEGKESEYAEFTSKYSFTPQSGKLIYPAGMVTLTFTAGEHGNIQAWFGGERYQSGSSVSKGARVQFMAIPDNGYEVDTWSVKVGGVPQEDLSLTGNGATCLVNATDSVEVQVTFKEKTYRVDYGHAPDIDGELTAHLDSAQGALVESGSDVPASSSVVFVAEPAQGRYVDRWTLTDNEHVETVITVNGQPFRENIYTIAALSVDANIKVYFVDQRTLSVAATAINEEGETTTDMGTVSVASDPAADNGKYPGGARLTFTAAPASEDYQILEWRSYDGDTYEVLQGNLGEYVVPSLQEDLDIRVVFREKQEFTVTFGPEAAGGGTVAADAAGALESGTAYPAGTPITFTAHPADGMETAWWTVNGVVQDAGDAPNRFEIPALSNDVDVRAAFRATPAVTFDAPEHGKLIVRSGGTDLTSGAAVPYGSEVTVVLEPETGFEVRALTVNGVDVLEQAAYSGGSTADTDDREYAFAINLRQSYAVAAEFQAIPAPTVSFSVNGDGGTVSASYARKGMEEYAVDSATSPITAYRDGVVTFIAAPEQSHRVTGWTLNGDAVGGKSNTLTLPITAGMAGDQSLTVSFEETGEALTFSHTGEGGLVVALDQEGTAEIKTGTTLTADAEVYFTAAPAEGWEVKNWTVDGQIQKDGDDQIITDTQFIYQAAAGVGADIVVNFTRPVTVHFSGEHGTVTAASAGIVLADGESVPMGSAVTFRATPDRGYTFVGWDNGSKEEPLTLIADEELAVTALFEAVATCRITFADPVGGIMSAKLGGTKFSSNMLAKYGDEIVFAVTPADPDHFSVTAWTDNGAAAAGEGNTFTLTVQGDHEIAAVVSRSGWALTFGVEGDGAGGITAVQGPDATPVVSGGSVPVGSTVTLTAAPPEGQMVEGWYLDNSFVPDSKGRNTYVIDAMTRAQTIQVRFMPQETCTVSLTYAGAGAGTVTATVDGEPAGFEGKDLNVNYGAHVVLTAAPRPYNKFDGWSEDAMSADTVLDLGRVTLPQSLTATFNPLAQVKFTVIWADGGSVTAQAGYGTPLADLHLVKGTPISVTPGQTLKLTAAPEGEMAVTGWTVNGAPQGTLNNELTLTVPSSALNVGVSFGAPVGATIDLTQSQNGSFEVKHGDTVLKSGDRVASGTVLTLTARPDSGYRFSGWGGSISGTQAVTTYEVKQEDTALTISASFTAISTEPSGGGGGGSGGGSTGDKVNNPDGSTTTTRTDQKTGAVSEITTHPDGTVAEKVTEKDGTVTQTVKRSDGVEGRTVTTPDGKITADITIPKKALDTTGAAPRIPVVKAPIPALPVDEAVDKAPVVSVKTDAPVRVVLPVQESASGVVAILVHPDGTEELVRKAIVDQDGLVVPLEGTAALKIVDNSKSFTDVEKTHWASGPVEFVTSRELFQGVGGDMFGLNGEMTRGMLVQVLYRLENEPESSGDGFSDTIGVWYHDAAAWAAEIGVVTGTGSGFDGERSITREEMAVILARHALWQAVSSKSNQTTAAPEVQLKGFQDTDHISQWAEDSMAWAVDTGILNGKDGQRLDPQGTATRAEVAAMIQRFVALTVQSA